MMRPVRLYLAGPAGSGKTTVAEMLVRDYGFARVSLGGLCREEAGRRGLPEDRETLQAMGDMLRGTDPARLAVLAWGRIQRVAAPVVIGVRLNAEAQCLRARGAVGAGLLAPEDVRQSRLLGRDDCASVPAHATEAEATAVPVDFELDTTGGAVGGLQSRVRLLVARAHLVAAERRRAALRLTCAPPRGADTLADTPGGRGTYGSVRAVSGPADACT